MSNPQNDALSANELRDLERLVDGELDLDGQRRLVRRLEVAEDGWRRCALAFLESQALGQELGTAAFVEPAPLSSMGSDASGHVSMAEARSASRRSSFSGYHSTLAIAASFLLAFGLGLALRGGLPSSGGNGGMHLATPERSAPDAVAHAEQKIPPVDAVVVPPRDLASATESDVSPAVRLVEANDSAPTWTSREESIIPPHIRRALERLGHRVEEHRELLPIELDNGTQGYIPAERVELHYVGSQYQ